MASRVRKERARGEASLPTALTRRDCGFTLVETLLAVSIFAAIAGTIYLSFATGMEAQSRVEVASEELQRARYALELIAEDVGSPHRISPGMLEGRPDGLRMAVGWDPVGGAETVEYRVLTGPDDVPVLFRRLLSGEEVLTEVDLLRGVKSFEIAYFISDQKGLGMWVSEWEGREGLPYAVKVKIRVSAGGAGTEHERLIPLAPSWLRPPPQAVGERAA